MPDSIRTKETHWRVERLSDFLGISAQPDGTAKEFKAPKHLDQKELIGDKWDFYSGSKTSDKDYNTGIYQKRSRKIKKDEQGKILIETGGFVETYTLLQRLECMQDDSTRMIGGDEASGFQIPTADGRFKTYESMFQLLADMAYTQSWTTMALNEIKINCIQLMSMARDTLKALGVPVGIKTIPINMGENECEIAVGGLKGETPTVSSQLGLIMMNLGLLVAGNLKVVKTDKD